jgi:putative transposase
VKYAWIDKMAGKELWWFSVALACELLEVSRSGLYDWRARRDAPATPREREQQLLLAAITVEHIASSYRYGSPRIHAELVAQGWKVGVNRIARLMALHGLEGRWRTSSAALADAAGQGRPGGPGSAAAGLHRRGA